MNTEVIEYVPETLRAAVIKARNQDGFVVSQPYTDKKLLREITDKINIDKNSKIAVLFTVEWALEFRFRGFTDVTVFTEEYDPLIQRMADIGWFKYLTLEQAKNMKFAVVAGNPPFKNGSETGGKSSLWRKFVLKSWDLVEENGYHAMIAPQFSNSSKDLGDIYTKNQTICVWTKISDHFPKIGSSFCAWIVKNTPKTKKTFFVDENLNIDITKKQLPKNLGSISIINKIMNNDLFECKSSPEYLHTSVADGKDDDHLCSKKSSKLKYFIRRTSGDNYHMYGAVEPTDYYSPKVVMTFSGNPHFKFHGKDDPIGTIKFQSGHILVKNKKEGENLINLYNTKLYKFVQDQQATGGFRGKKIYELPVLPLNKKWTDEELYEHFKLTPEEIEYVESSVK